MAKHNLGCKAAKFTARNSEKAVIALARWATTDHMGIGQMLKSLPAGMGFAATLHFILMHFLASMVGMVLGVVWIFMVLGYVIPFLFF